MICESCGIREANVHVAHVVNDVTHELHVCEECAAEKGITSQGPVSLADILMNLGGLEERDIGGGTRVCPGCATSLADLRRDSRMGCPRCYDVFAEEARDFAEDMQGAESHVGKTPKGVVAQASSPEADSLAALQKRLETAIAEEDFEEAARLRDEIRSMKAASHDGREA